MKELSPARKAALTVTGLTIATTLMSIPTEASLENPQNPKNLNQQKHDIIAPFQQEGWKGTVTGKNGEELGLTWKYIPLEESQQSPKSQYETSEYGYNSEVKKKEIKIARTVEELQAIKDLIPGSSISDKEYESLDMGQAIVYAFGGEFSTTGYYVETINIEKEKEITVMTVQIKGPQKGDFTGQMITEPYRAVFVPDKKELEGGIKVRWMEKGKEPDEEIVMNTVYENFGEYKESHFTVVRSYDDWAKIKKELNLSEEVTNYDTRNTRIVFVSGKMKNKRVYQEIEGIKKFRNHTEVYIKDMTGRDVINQRVQIIDAPKLNEVNLIELQRETFKILQ